MGRTRRALIKDLVAAGALAATGVSCAPTPSTQTTRPRRIGWLTFREPPTEISLRQTLPEYGWVEGRDFVIEIRHPDGVHDRLPALAAELVSLPVDILIAVTLNPALAAKQATSSIPIVFSSVGGDPVELGLVASLAKPGGNITGVGQGGSTEFHAKRLELLKETVPSVSRVTMLTNMLAPDQTIALRAMQDVAPAFNVELQSVQLNFIDEVDRALEDARRQRPDGLITIHAGSFFGALPASPALRKVLDFAVAGRHPQIFGQVEFARAGGLLAMGASLDETTRNLAKTVDKILRGVHPSEIPVAVNKDFLLGVNLAMARKLGITIPDSVLRQATEVVQ